MSPFVLRGEQKSKVKDLTQVHVIPTNNKMQMGYCLSVVNDKSFYN